jgi:hypothetical protein
VIFVVPSLPGHLADFLAFTHVACGQTEGLAIPYWVEPQSND